MALGDDEQCCVASDPLILGGGDDDRVRAVRITALAEKLELRFVLDSIYVLADLVDSLVDLAKERFVQSDRSRSVVRHHLPPSPSPDFCTISYGPSVSTIVSPSVRGWPATIRKRLVCSATSSHCVRPTSTRSRHSRSAHSQRKGTGLSSGSRPSTTSCRRSFARWKVRWFSSRRSLRVATEKLCSRDEVLKPMASGGLGLNRAGRATISLASREKGLGAWS